MSVVEPPSRNPWEATYPDLVTAFADRLREQR